MNKRKKPIGRTVGLKIILIVMFFLPIYTQKPYDPVNTTSLIASVLQNPLVVSIPWVLPVLKAVFLCVTVLPFLMKANSERILLWYYACTLIGLGLFQNMAQTDAYGFVWIFGNTLVQFSVCAFCIYDAVKGKTSFLRQSFNKQRCWIIPLMALAFLMPYALSDVGQIQPGFSPSILYNEAGVTYCMITPVVIGIMLLFSKSVYKPTLSVISFVGLIFGLLNMLTWFGAQRAGWWMGILHLPLVILSLFGLISVYKENSM